MKATSRLVWSATAKRIPDSINSKLVGTYPSIVQADDGNATCAFFVRAAKEESFNSMWSGSATCLVRPQFVKTPHGPLVVAYCMAAPKDAEGSQPFFSETAIFPRLTSLPAHREFAGVLQSRSEVYLIVCNENGACIINSKASILEQWRAELAEKAKAFDEGKQITDERTAIMSLYWYQERYNPSSRIFEVSH
ncbi:MAG TPA: hypothetical protein VI338_00485 [Nitrososphaera sp.]|nr:hypothetical protein [Nitrososphaera sp.]